MTRPTRRDCALTNRDETVAAYLAGRLDEFARADFETHMLLCERCQDELRFLSATRALAERHRPSLRASAWAAAALVAAAAVIVAVAWPRGAQPDSETLAALGRVDAAPVYFGLPVRGGDNADSLFEAGMLAYDEGNWQTAERALRQAAALGSSPDVTWFFIGASALMADRAAFADSAFSRVIAQGEGPYLAEARFYRAKALLRVGDRSSAMTELARLPARAAVTAHGAALADSLRSTRTR
jgi:hypothetical protein